MSPALLDIIDSNLQLWHQDATLQSPGYAMLNGGSYNFGVEARAAARLHPRNINTRFWWQLNTEALQPALGPARHTADLAHAHLENVYRASGSPEELVLAVSSSMQRDQLSLLLGIIEQCPFEAVALVNRSVALASIAGVAARQFHLEVQLHQALLTELTSTDGIVQFQRSIALPGCGLLQLQERLVATIAASFIRQTRFDPRRKADTEQTLYDALPGSLRALQEQPETNIEVNGYRARINRTELAEAGQRLFSSAKEAMGSLSSSDQLLLDPLVAMLPGAETQFTGAHILAVDTLPNSIELHQSLLVQRGQALNHVTELPCLSRAAPKDVIAPAPLEPQREEPQVPDPTHVLLADASALALTTAGTTLTKDLRIFSRKGVWCLDGNLGSVQINDGPASGEIRLVRGDTITLDNGSKLQLIEVRP
ncbi:MAG: hypothetical protein ACJA09_002650 [Alcanivorax sp.]|jgi:hypothetical protein